METEAALMVTMTFVTCFVLFAGTPLLLAAIGSCHRVFKKMGAKAENIPMA
jgi:hypothetical protein